MTTHTNPVTKEKFDELESYVQSLIVTYQKAKQQLYKWKQDEDGVIAALDELVSDVEPTLTKGKVTLTGMMETVTVERKVNASYPKDRGAEHPIRKLLPEFDASLAGMVKMEYKEAGAQIQDLLDRFRHKKLRPNDNEELARALLAVRTEKPGKPGIQIEARIDISSSTSDEGAGASPLY